MFCVPDAFSPSPLPCPLSVYFDRNKKRYPNKYKNLLTYQRYRVSESSLCFFSSFFPFSSETIQGETFKMWNICSFHLPAVFLALYPCHTKQLLINIPLSPVSKVVNLFLGESFFFPHLSFSWHFVWITALEILQRFLWALTDSFYLIVLMVFVSQQIFVHSFSCYICGYIPVT